MTTFYLVLLIDPLRSRVALKSLQLTKILNIFQGVLAAGLFPKVKTVGYNLEKGFSYLKDDNDNRNYIHIKSVNFGAKLPEKCLIFYKVRNGKNDTILVEDSTNLRQTVVELFTPWGDEIEEIKVLRYRMERYIEDYLAGNPGWEVRMMVRFFKFFFF